MSETNDVTQAQEAYAAACKEHVAATKALFAVEVQIERLQKERDNAEARRGKARTAMREAEHVVSAAIRTAHAVESLDGIPEWMRW